MRIGQRPALEITWIRDDRAVDEARYRVHLFVTEARMFDVRISLTAKAQARASPEEYWFLATWSSFRRFYEQMALTVSISSRSITGNSVEFN
jgi:hypothetical protein